MASKTNGYRANGTNGYARGDSVRRGTGEPRVSDRDRRSTRESGLSDAERQTTEEPPSRRYTEEDAQLVDEAKRTHKATTASAQRAAKTAAKTRELGAQTLEELQRQGDKFDTLDQDLNAIDADVKESKGLLAYMQRCCLCFLCSCCCDCDPSVKEDKTRKRRVQARAQDRKEYQKAITDIRQDRNGLNNAIEPQENEDQQRSSLFQSKADIAKGKQDKRDANSAYQIGKDLDEPDRQEILKETELQERYLDDIGSALDDMKRMGNTMGEELKRQEELLNRVDTHVDQTVGGLNEVQASAEKTLGKKGTRKVNSSYGMPNKASMAKHYARAASKF